MGANPVQVEVGDFDEAIEIIEDEAESKCLSLSHSYTTTKYISI